MPGGLCKSNLIKVQDASYPLSFVIMTMLTDPNATFDLFIGMQDAHCPLGSITMTVLTDPNATFDSL